MITFCRNRAVLPHNRLGIAMNQFDFKDTYAVVPLLAAIFTYYNNIKVRLDWIADKKRRIGPLGLVHWWIDFFPNKLMVLISVLAIGSSLSYFAFRLFVAPNSTGSIAKFLQKNYELFPIVFFIWLAFAVIGYFNWIPMLFERLIGISASARQTIGFANASWHNERGEKAPALALSETGRPFAQKVVDGLAIVDLNPNLALRPADVTDEEAANILFFGHVVEQFYTATGSTEGVKTGWTRFYEIMGSVARADDRPFSAAGVKAFADQSFFFKVVKRYDVEASRLFPTPAVLGANPEQDLSPRLPSAQQLEEAVDRAFIYLRKELSSDARNIGGRLFRGYSYAAALRRSSQILNDEELRRQFAKLAVIWRVWGDHYQRPDLFRIPFSRGILVLLLDENFIITDADEFRTDDQRVRVCCERAQDRSSLSAFDVIEKTKNPTVVLWRNVEKEKSERLGIDWLWYVFYRVDQHLYHMGRVHLPKALE